LLQFWNTVYAPYFIGALGPGIGLSLLCYYVTIPLVLAYQKARAAKAVERHERRNTLKAALAEAAAKLKARGEEARKGGDDDAPGAP
jgi:predicted cobalt transporter CbtA